MEETKRIEEEKLKLKKSESEKNKFILSKNISLVPTFEESDPDKSFTNFEKTAKHLKWPKEEWPWLLQPKLVGKAHKVFNHLEDTSDYDFVKRAINDLGTESG